MFTSFKIGTNAIMR